MDEFLKDIKTQFPKYESLKEQVIHVLAKLAAKHAIEIFNIEGRVKTIESLQTKLSLKNYSSPENEVEDLCGVRVICYYESDLDFIEGFIRHEFDVLSGSDKQKEIDDDRFGYSSRHFIVRIKDSWLDVPLFSDFGGLKIEIQIRTMLMHTWAAISHKLLYKNEGDAPREIKRSLSKLSALIELADEQFDNIKSEKSSYRDFLAANDEVKFADEPLNSDNLIVLINKYSPHRFYNNDKIPVILEEIKIYDSTVSDFEQRILACLPFLESLEMEEAQGRPLPLWNLEGFCRTVLDLTCDDYFAKRWGEGLGNMHFVHVCMKYRDLIKQSQKK